jgi:hypothetical protein
MKTHTTNQGVDNHINQINCSTDCQDLAERTMKKVKLPDIQIISSKATQSEKEIGYQYR